MTREEAENLLDDFLDKNETMTDYVNRNDYIVWTQAAEDNVMSEYTQLSEKLIKALEQEPCEDAISRQAVNKLVDELASAISDERCYIPQRSRSTGTIMQDILNLPSVTPQPKTGHWIKKKPYPMLEYDYECSECGHDVIDKTPYCSDCGAKMKREEGAVE